ncbi:MAG: carbohydrate binding family 9 domain-containing protein [Calditrichaeota bacterium]|nr:carbohydrate binding family 9 domain-containing protein [Calditrichota bacterium]
MKARIFIVILGLLISRQLFGTDQKPILTAVRITSGIKLDGYFDEPSWKLATPATNFKQREPMNGAPATEKTMIRILYDQKNLYIGIWCFDSQPDKIIANTLVRDSDLRGDDQMTIAIDTYLDHRTGFVFATNPLGARLDAYQYAPERDPNKNWNGVWDVRAQVTSKGWQAEIVIPFKTLRFRNLRQQIWGINFQRIIRRKNEEDLWSGYGYNEGITYFSCAGELQGLIDVKRGHQIELFPYGKFGIQQQDSQNSSHSTVTKAGFNLKYGLTPTLTTDFTVNTDFAQVEADRARINLTRFSLYYPEKREFFLEGADIFRFGSIQRAQVFYSRSIGISDAGEQIPLLGGGRLTGRAGKYSIGILDAQTQTKGETPGANFFVARMQRDILQQSKIGVIATQKYVPRTGYFNRAFGADFNLYFSNFLGNKNLVFGGYLAGTQTPNLSGNNLSGRFFIDFPNDFIDSYWYAFEIQPNFNPEVGFVRRKGIKQFGGAIHIMPRPGKWGIRKLAFKPLDFDYTTDLSGRVETISSEFRPLGFRTESGEFFEFNLQRTFERLDDDFNIYDDYVIPAGAYWFNHSEIQFATNSSRPISGGFFLNWGNFYSGKRTELFLQSVLKFSSHFSLSLDFTRNNIKLKQGHFQTQEWGSRIGYAFSTRLDTRAFVQWNNEDQELNINFRLHWIPNLGSHVYLVYNHLLSTESSFFKTENRVLVMKMDYLFRW